MTVVGRTEPYRSRSHRRSAARGARPHAAAGGAAERRGPARAARSADEPDPVGPGPHRALRGALAHPQPRRADRVRRDAGPVQPVRASPQHPRRRWRCPGSSECREIMDEIRGRVLARLISADFDAANPLLRDGFVYQMVLQHEYQHNETILQTLQLKQRRAVHAARAARARRRRAAPAGRRPGRDGAVPRRRRSRSAPTIARRPTTTSGRRTRSSVAPFWIDVHPVTNQDFLVFIARRRVRDAGVLVRGGLAVAHGVGR